jgi:hypothetical protein
MKLARRPASIILSVVFGLLALNAWAQVVLVALRRSDDPLNRRGAVALFALLCAAYFRSDSRR